MRTKQVILDAARSCFAENGYARTSVAQVAAAAGVAATTVYASVGGKPQLIQALTQSGVDAKSIDDFLQQVAGLADGRAIVWLTAHSTAAVNEELLTIITLLINNRLADPAVAQAHDFAVKVYRERLAIVASRLRECGALRPEVSIQQTTEILWFYFGHGAWRTIRDLGWGWKRSADWLAEQASHALVVPSAPADAP